MHSADQAKTSVPFATTHWSVVLAAGNQGDPDARQALETLCRAYWIPVYAFLRRRGHAPADAEDYTQGFFLRILDRGVLSKADPDRGRFRSFLLACLNHYVADERDKARAARREGARPLSGIDTNAANERYLSEPADTNSPDRLFERKWALAVMEHAMENLREEHRIAGLSAEFEALREFLAGSSEHRDYEQAAARTGQSPNAVAVAVHRLRRRYRDFVRREVAATVANPDDLEAEMRHLLGILRE